MSQLRGQDFSSEMAESLPEVPSDMNELGPVDPGAADDMVFPLSPERAALVEEHLNVAWALVGKYRGRQQYPTYDDLTQEAYTGLVLAAGRFDEDYGVSFETFAGVTIKGCVKRAFREARMVKHRKAFESYPIVEEARQQFHIENGRPASQDELADITGVSADVIQAMGEVSSVDSLDAPVFDDGISTKGDLLPSKLPDPEETAVAKLAVSQAMTVLTDTQQAVIQRRHLDGDDPTQAELAAPMGVSQVIVSRHERKAMAAMRSFLTKDM